ncbi:UTP--glucose-1-phosphate uridylyltransferase [Candidatus Poribacteria bacterium]|nr:UTP--glucose-1-phosphate uridylyltransferase [Candidatus Poribacteria bacterium]
MVSKAVIPAAGVGTRLLPATKSQPKEMLPVGRKPTIQYVVEEIYAAGIRDILIITSQQKRAIEDHFDYDANLVEWLSRSGKPLEPINHIEMGVQILYTRQSVPKGLADAIGLARSFVGDEDFVVCLGDSIIKSEESGSLIKRMMDAHDRMNAKATIAFEEVDRRDVSKYGIAKPREGLEDIFWIEDLIEKPSIDEAPSNLAVAARYIFSPQIFDFIDRTPPGKGGEIQITDSIRLMLQSGYPILGVRLADGERRYDIGNFRSYYEAFFDFSLSDPELGETFRRYVLERLR